jgi:CHASE2 domain-containing sensor protein
VRAALVAKGRAHWIIALLVLLLSLVVTRYGVDFFHLRQARNVVSQWLMQKTARGLKAHRVRLVLIHSDDFWKEPLDGRSPVNRHYLAQLVEMLDRANANVIALDFDMRLPDPQRLQEFAPYLTEEQHLVTALLAAAEHHWIVLSKTIRGAFEDGTYRLEPDFYQLFGICSQLNPDGHWTHAGTDAVSVSSRAAEHINCGYIALPFDMRELPNQLPIAGGLKLDSFALAVTRAEEPVTAKEVSGSRIFGSYLALNEFEESGNTYSAHDVMRGERRTLDALNGKLVIVGADWNTLAQGRGAETDLHDTPVGRMVGAKIHANFAEAFFDTRALRGVPEWVTLVLEILLGVAAAVAFALLRTFWAKLLALCAAAMLMFAIEWISLNVLGVFLEVFIPVAGLWIHSALERFIGTPSHE